MRARTSRLQSLILLVAVWVGVLCAGGEKPLRADRDKKVTPDRIDGKDGMAEKAMQQLFGPEPHKPVVTSSSIRPGTGDPNPDERVPLSDAPMRAGKFDGADLNEDGVLDEKDLAVIRNSLESTVGQARYDSRSDLNGDGHINCTDFQIWMHMVGPKQPKLFDAQLPCSGRNPIQ